MIHSISPLGRRREPKTLLACLRRCPQLKHSQIRYDNAPDDVSDADRWQPIIASVISFQFNFNFSTELNDVERVLRRFRTYFWLEEKRWFVAYHHRSLFTQSFPDLAEMLMHPNQSIYSTLTDQLMKGLQWYRDDKKEEPKPLLPMELRSMIDFSHIEHCTVHRLSRALFRIMITSMPCLSSLAVPADEIGAFFQNVDDLVLTQIRRLRLPATTSQSDFDLQNLGRSFPLLEHWGSVMIQSMAQITTLLTISRRLSSLTLRKPPLNQSKHPIAEWDHVINYVEEWTGNPVTWQTERLYHRHVGTEHLLLHLWIENRRVSR